MSDAKPVPFATVYVTLSKQEHIQLVMEANSWKTRHRHAVQRAQWREGRYQRVLRQVKEQGAQREAVLRAELELARAKIRDLQQRMFGRKSERRKGGTEQQARALVWPAHRGHQRGAPGHGRTMQSHLPERSEWVEIDTPQCPRCGLALSIFPGTQDSEVLEIEVQAYRRVIHRRRYRPSCGCGCVAGIVTAPPPARLIERGKFGMSVWASVLLDKFLYGRPSHRLLQDLADHGLNLSPGTLAGGLRALAPLFEPLDQALVRKLRSEPHWHADETRWAVFVERAGKVGHRWYLWVFHSSSVVHYVLDASRSAEVVEGELAGVHSGFLSCDRYAAYKKFARLHPGVVLAFCWAHQRRDLLELANDYPELSPWAMGWVDAIADLYHLNGLRLQARDGSAERAAARHADLQQAVQRMAEERDAALADPLLAEPVAKVLQSMTVHWAGLTVFVDHPGVPMDNNVAERDARLAVVGRKNFYGSGSEWSGHLAATMYSVLKTVKLWRLNARTWLSAYLQACADNGNRAPPDIQAFLPWSMDAVRLAAMRAGPPGARTRTEGIDTS
ncbi:MAG TPA: IS66 family transposase [Casimicrobiaceae bacterium]|nr:IS66 family transposase [Casimicrobiaceae bacterium]